MARVKHDFVALPLGVNRVGTRVLIGRDIQTRSIASPALQFNLFAQKGQKLFERGGQVLCTRGESF